MHNVEHTLAFLDVQPFVDGTTRTTPDPVSGLPMIHVMLPLGPGETWRARVLPMITYGLDDNRAWSHVSTGAAVRIPLLPYRISKELPETVMGVFELAQSMVEGCQGAVRTHVIIGKPVQDLSDQGAENYRVWLGFAARMS